MVIWYSDRVSYLHTLVVTRTTLILHIHILHTHICTYIYSHIHTYTHTLTCKYTYTHTYTYTYTQGVRGGPHGGAGPAGILLRETRRSRPGGSMCVYILLVYYWGARLFVAVFGGVGWLCDAYLAVWLYYCSNCSLYAILLLLIHHFSFFLSSFPIASNHLFNIPYITPYIHHIPHIPFTPIAAGGVPPGPGSPHRQRGLLHPGAGDRGGLPCGGRAWGAL